LPFEGKNARETRAQIENEREWVGGSENWQNERKRKEVGEGERGRGKGRGNESASQVCQL
jgi:hypothetical protein